MKTTKNSPIRGNDFITAVNEASCLYGEFISREFERIGMKQSYRHFLKSLMEHDSLTQLELVKLTGLKAPTISISVRNMERDGIVRREKSSSDHRETHVYITEKGRKMYAKALEAVKKAEKTMLKGLSAEELQKTREVLNMMITNLSKDRNRAFSQGFAFFSET